MGCAPTTPMVRLVRERQARQADDRAGAVRASCRADHRSRDIGPGSLARDLEVGGAQALVMPRRE